MKLNLRYQENLSALHNLNPLVKITWAVGLAVLVLIINHPVFLLTLLLSTLIVVSTGKIWRQWAGIMKLSLFLCLAIVLINILVNSSGVHVLWQAGFKIPVLGYPAVTLEALLFSLGMSFRLLTIISVFAILTLTVHPDDFVQAMLKIRMPPKSVLVVSLAMRFLPVLVDDAERIKTVQQSRGLQLESGNLIQRVRNGTAVLIPLFSNSLDRTIQISEAMESRAFGSGSRRIFYKPLFLKGADWLGLGLTLLALALAIFFNLQGWLAYRYFPAFDRLEMDLIQMCSLGLLVGLVISPAPLALIEKRKKFDII